MVMRVSNERKKLNWLCRSLASEKIWFVPALEVFLSDSPMLESRGWPSARVGPMGWKTPIHLLTYLDRVIE